MIFKLETPTLKEYLEMVASALNVKPNFIKSEEKRETKKEELLGQFFSLALPLVLIQLKNFSPL